MPNHLKIKDMDENTKLYVFSKREVALIFLFMFLIAITSFVFGVKIGKNYSYEQAGFTPEDRAKVELLSGQEEQVNEVVEERKAEEDKGQLLDLNKKLEERIKEETSGQGKRFENEQVNEPAPSEPSREEETPDSGNQMVEPVPGTVVEQPETTRPSTSKDQYSGKYTIQLGSHRSLDEAQAFAEGFKVRGYNPIINEAELPNRGIWYRVSLGVFETVSEAKEFVKKEQSLFQGQEYIFYRFD
jgi:cell division protein FtsN